MLLVKLPDKAKMDKKCHILLKINKEPVYSKREDAFSSAKMFITNKQRHSSIFSIKHVS
jgi:hypothetical protein